MPEIWKKYKLGEIGKAVTGKTPSSKNPEEFGSLMPFVTPTDFKNYVKLIYKTDRSISEIGVKSNKPRIIPENSILVTCIGSDMGKIAINKDACLTNQQINSLIPNKEIANANFVFYSLKDKYQLLRTMATGGSTMPIINKSDFERIELEIPPIEEQRRIAEILSALDEKIELNLEMNRTLEKIAQATFKHWFVDFQFPGFDGELVDGLPKGWKKAGIGEIISVQNGYAFKSSDFKAHGNNGVIKIKNISNNVVDIENMQFVDENIANIVAERFRISGGDLLIAMTGAEVGKVGIVPKTEKYLWLNQRVGSFKEKVEFAKWFVYLILSTNEYQNVLLNSAMGSAQPNISSSQIERVESTIPAENLIKQFGELVNPFFGRICENYFENQTLTQIRNGLLPKLMSGKIRLGE